MTSTLKKHSLVELLPTDRPNIILDIVYATTNNFMSEVLYSSAHCFMHLKVKQALLEIADDLHQIGLGIKVFDGYRPLAVQRLMWEKFPDERFVANPHKMGGRHTRGTAVDLTLIDLNQKELEMPTPFDAFDEKAHSDFEDLPLKVIQNRRLLRNTMEKFGFQHLPTEWWHYDFSGWQDDSLYPPLDIKFEEI